MYKILLTNLFIENKKVLKPYFDSEFFYFHFRENICVRYGANFLVKQKKNVELFELGTKTKQYRNAL